MLIFLPDWQWYTAPVTATAAINSRPKVKKPSFRSLVGTTESVNLLSSRENE